MVWQEGEFGRVAGYRQWDGAFATLEFQGRRGNKPPAGHPRDQTGWDVPAGSSRPGNEQKEGHVPANLGWMVPRVDREELGGYARGTKLMRGRPTPHVRAGAGEINGSQRLQSRGYGGSTSTSAATAHRRHDTAGRTASGRGEFFSGRSRRKGFGDKRFLSAGTSSLAFQTDGERKQSAPSRYPQSTLF